MRENKSKSQPESQGINRRDFVRAGAKAAYVTPLVLAAVTAAERPAYAGSPICD
jgi:hypothetical protein